MDNDMNEKIKELAEQANIPKYNLEYGTELCIAPHLEKFAESIIKETIKIIQATAAESVDLDRTLVENVSLTVNDIKKNFGIEK